MAKKKTEDTMDDIITKATTKTSIKGDDTLHREAIFGETPEEKAARKAAKKEKKERKAAAKAAEKQAEMGDTEGCAHHEHGEGGCPSTMNRLLLDTLQDSVVNINAKLDAIQDMIQCMVSKTQAEEVHRDIIQHINNATVNLSDVIEDITMDNIPGTTMLASSDGTPDFNNCSIGTLVIKPGKKSVIKGAEQTILHGDADDDFDDDDDDEYDGWPYDDEGEDEDPFTCGASSDSAIDIDMPKPCPPSELCHDLAFEYLRDIFPNIAPDGIAVKYNAAYISNTLHMLRWTDHDLERAIQFIQDNPEDAPEKSEE